MTKPLYPHRQARGKTALALLACYLLVAPLNLVGCAMDALAMEPPYMAVGGDKPWAGLQDEINAAEGSFTLDVSEYHLIMQPGPSLVITVPRGLTLTLRAATPEQLFESPLGSFSVGRLAFICEGDNTVVLEHASLSYQAGNAGELPMSTMHFKAGGNRLVLVGANDVCGPFVEYNGFTEPYIDQTEGTKGHGAAIGVPEGVSLTIEGSGRLTASGMYGAAGIGGGFGESSGTICIAGGDVKAYSGLTYSGDAGAAIGGGGNADGGTTVITGGRVDARGSNGAAAIGGGYGAGGGRVTINGGFVEAHADMGGAGIGGGVGGSGGSIMVTGGEVVAYSGSYESPLSNAPAIGNGSGGRGGTLAMSGGKLAAMGSGRASHQAIDCKVTSLPGSYQWRAGDLDQATSNTMLSYPGSAFSNSSKYSYVVIESK